MAAYLDLNDATKAVAEAFETDLRELAITTPSMEMFIDDAKHLVKGGIWKKFEGLTDWADNSLESLIVGSFIVDIDFWELCDYISQCVSDGEDY